MAPHGTQPGGRPTTVGSPRTIGRVPYVPQTPDTSRDVEDRLFALYRALDPEERLRRVLRFSDSLRAIALARIRADFPDAPEREVRLRLASRWLDRETLLRVWGWDPRDHGIG